MKAALEAESAHAKVLGPTSAPVKTAGGGTLAVDASAEGMPSIAFDAVFIPGGAASVKALSGNGVALHYVLEAYKHLKAIAYAGDAKQLIDTLHLDPDAGLLAVSDSKSFGAFFDAMKQHRVWAREPKAKAIPA
jgi:catalase